MSKYKWMAYALIAGLILNGFFLLVHGPLMSKLGPEPYGGDKLHPVSEGSNTVELVYVGHDKRSQPVFAIYYALAAGFTDIYVGADRYRKVGKTAGVYFRGAAPVGQRPRYKITEFVLKPNDGNWYQWPGRGDVHVVIEDTHTKTEVGRWRGPGPGWAGPQAGEFVAAALKPKREIRWGNPHYPIGSSSIVESGTSATLLARDVRNVLRDCPKDYVVTPYPTDRTPEVRTSTWSFGMFAHPDSIVCSADGVFIFSNKHHWREIHAHWLAHDGTLMGEVHSSIPEMSREGTAKVARIVSVVVKGGKLHARMAYFDLNGHKLTTIPAYKEMDIIAPISVTQAEQRHRDPVKP